MENINNNEDNDRQKELEKCYENLKDCDYIRFTFYDINAVGRCKVIQNRHLKTTLKNGILSAAVMGIQTLDNLFNQSSEIFENGRCPNALFLPIFGTEHKVNWAGGSKYKIGEVETDIHWPTPGFPCTEFSTRNAAIKQLKTLRDMGFEVLSAYEFEYYIMKKGNDGKYASVSDITEYESSLVWTRYESLMYEIESNLYSAGVDIEHMHCEYSGGQFEMTTPPLYGIKSAEKSMIYKNCIKEVIGLKEDLLSTFMSKPIAKRAGSGCHFNHSLWKDGKPAFYDKNEKNNLSKIAQYFIAGQLLHARALTAFLSPTYNCYRRIARGLAVTSYANWGIDDRDAYVRVKLNEEKGPYLENRLAGAVANPYLMMAGILAAGIDGIRKKLPLPEERFKGEGIKRMPVSLKEAISALEEDTDFCEIVGKQLVDVFVDVKKNIEADMFKSDVAQDDAEDIEVEKNFYLQQL